ncbi:hypothetical protein [Candidatus Paracaedibacter symbiosus]|uniref:hypothetical protein n=1 Tax=Candidatus Paracaedibacter symbiosus TaxID=244582 RepID=UPI000509F468|nr:hypothetical protein [Candidatus Paracaedibacter symbiosus]
MHYLPPLQLMVSLMIIMFFSSVSGGDYEKQSTNLPSQKRRRLVFDIPSIVISDDKENHSPCQEETKNLTEVQPLADADPLTFLAKRPRKKRVLEKRSDSLLILNSTKEFSLPAKAPFRGSVNSKALLEKEEKASSVTKDAPIALFSRPSKGIVSLDREENKKNNGKR